MQYYLLPEKTKSQSDKTNFTFFIFYLQNELNGSTLDKFFSLFKVGEAWREE